ncbi:hypothetical protein [Microvirga arabica]|uniref:hypothetical protein n=1 Tax=Microvirga arabica TaxID=1128671 RepID=UPI0019398575|nr:hypothetical protein [Microvirga arabica]MBM1173869.1 hypothetical protein [Microvirga arabica]
MSTKRGKEASRLFLVGGTRFQCRQWRASHGSRDFVAAVALIVRSVSDTAIQGF